MLTHMPLIHQHQCDAASVVTDIGDIGDRRVATAPSAQLASNQCRTPPDLTFSRSADAAAEGQPDVIGRVPYDVICAARPSPTDTVTQTRDSAGDCDPRPTVCG